MQDFEAFALKQIKQALSAADASELLDVYVVSFFVYDHDNDPRTPTLTVGYNTNERWHSCTPTPGQDQAWPIASDSDEAKWNYAFWLQNKLVVLGEPGTKGAALCKAWFKSAGLWFTDAEDERNPDACEEIAERMTSMFVELCIRLACTLHEEGFITTCFGRSVPIIVHELEYYSEIADQCQRANPSGLADEFVAWVNEAN